MKIKLFTHQSDPDGIGCYVLASLVYPELDTSLCKNVDELNEKLEKFITNKEGQKYDKIFITDLCPSEKLLQKIEKSTSPVQVFDHHLTSCGYAKHFPFVTSLVEKNGFPTCGTELFYDFLKESFPEIKTLFVDQFVHLTKLHDTWEWKKENNIQAFQLQILFQYLGCYGYYYYWKSECEKERTITTYNDQELSWIKIQEKLNREKLENLMNHLIIKKQENYTSISVIGNYEYRNILAEEIKKQNIDGDILVLFAYDNGTISFRSLKEIPVNRIALMFGGGGHEKSASCTLTKENEQKLIRKFLA